MKSLSLSTTRSHASTISASRSTSKGRTGSESKLQSEARRRDGSHSHRSLDRSVSQSQFADETLSESVERTASSATRQELSSPLSQPKPQQPGKTRLPKPSASPETFTAVGPALLKQFKAIPGDLQAATGRFHRYSPSTQQTMDEIKSKLKELVQVEKDYKAAIDRGHTAEAECHQRIMKTKLDIVSSKFKELRMTLNTALVTGTGGSKKQRQQMIKGLLNMQNQINEQLVLVRPQRPARLVRQDAQRQLIEKPKSQSRQSGTISSLVDLEKSIGGSAEGVGDLPKSPQVVLPVHQEQPTKSDVPPITSFDRALQEKRVSREEGAKLTKQLNAFKAELEAEKAKAERATSGTELSKEFAALKRRIEAFESLSYKLDPEIKRLMKAVQVAMKEIMKDGIEGDEKLLAYIQGNFTELRERTEDWMVKADHIDAMQGGKTMAKMNAFLKHLERAAQAAANPSMVG